MKSLYFNYDRKIENSYIITVKGNESSEEYSKRCASSCEKVEMPYKIWDAYDGTKPGEIIPPEHMQGDSFMSMLKIYDHYMTRGEVACALSHISLWVHCVKIDRPIVILEHDAIFIKKFTSHDAYNSIIYLGGQEQAEKGWPLQAIPPHASEGPNKHFICRAHAYSIDPAIAKNLLSYVLQNGIHSPLDIMIRADIFNITATGLYAYDKNLNATNNTTIKNRPIHGRTVSRNDKLEW